MEHVCCDARTCNCTVAIDASLVPPVSRQSACWPHFLSNCHSSSTCSSDADKACTFVAHFAREGTRFLSSAEFDGLSFLRLLMSVSFPQRPAINGRRICVDDITHFLRSEGFACNFHECGHRLPTYSVLFSCSCVGLACCRVFSCRAFAGFLFLCVVFWLLTVGAQSAMLEFCLLEEVSILESCRMGDPERLLFVFVASLVASLVFSNSRQTCLVEPTRVPLAWSPW